MKAWQYEGVGSPLRLVERDTPVPGPGQLVIKVRAAGMCHSDVGYVQGLIPVPRLPFVLGHEVAGEVTALGDGVDRFVIGDRVVLGGDPADPSGITPGVYSDGGYAEYTLGDAAYAVAIPEGVSFEQAAAAADAGSTSYGAVVTAGELHPGQRVGIIGLGGLGSTGAKIAALKGAEVYAAEPKRDLWDAARAAGVSTVVADASELENLGLDVVVDFAGFGTTTAGAIRAVRPHGRVVQVGLGKPEISLRVGDLVLRQVALVGFMGGATPDIEAVLQLMSESDLSITVTPITFDEIPDALERLTAGAITGRAVASLP